MKKRIFAVLLVVALVSSGTAFAKTYYYDGEGADDKKVTVSFDVKGPSGAGKRFLRRAEVQDFTIANATQKAECEGYPIELPVSYHFEKAIPIDKDEDFAAKVHLNNGQVAHVKGSFDGLAFVQGRFRMSGDVGGCTIETANILWDGFIRHPG